jgi:hypothetical protein
MVPTQQQVVHVTGSGQNYHEVLKIATAPVVAPQEGEVLVRVIMRPINPVRSACRLRKSGLHPLSRRALCSSIATFMHALQACAACMPLTTPESGVFYSESDLLLQADVYKITGQTKRDHIPLPFVPGNEGAHEFCCSVCVCRCNRHNIPRVHSWQTMLVMVQVSASLRPMARAHLAFRSVGRAHSHCRPLPSWANKCSH